MSYTMDYCFNYSKDFVDTAKDINECLGCSLAPYQDDAEDLFDQFMSMEFSLCTMNGYENDHELDFENFQYKLDFRTAMGDASARPIQLPSMLAVIYALHRSFGITGILVFDMQILVARYEERNFPDWGTLLYDTLSGTSVTGFGSHLKLIEQRIPEARQKYLDS